MHCASSCEYFVIPSLTLTSAYGYDAIRAYNTYQTSDFLDLAVASWAFGRNYTLSDEQVSSGRTPVKSFDLTARCGSGTHNNILTEFLTDCGHSINGWWDVLGTFNQHSIYVILVSLC